MKSCSKSEIRRCRPLLGTFVEIAARGKRTVDLERAIDAAFAAVAEVHRLMSFHDPQSDVSRMNRDAFPKGVTVHPWTWEVMNAARNFARESGGAFDVTVAPLLAGRNCLAGSSCAAVRTASWRDIFPRRNFEIFFRRRVIVDLGGIAKGFAVDRAVDVLKQNGVASGIVNAGGDIRVFGSTSRKVHLRNPKSPAQFSAILSVRNRAIATSATYFAPGVLIDGQTRRSLTSSISITVAACDCITADVLTKVVFVLREKAAALLAHYRADALLLERNGTPSWMFHSPCDTHDPTRFD
jgi:thiamine biosynthesis lipoprotein